MSSFYTDSTTVKAAKIHKCTWCAESIDKDEFYVTQRGVNDDGFWFTTKMHYECWSAFCEEGDGEYMPFCNDRPVKESQ